MKKIIKWFLYKDAHLDWFKHLCLGTICFVWVLFFMISLDNDLHLSLTISNFAAVGLGVGKELYDRFVKKKQGDARDIFWTIAGGLILTIIILVYGIF